MSRGLALAALQEGHDDDHDALHRGVEMALRGGQVGEVRLRRGLGGGDQDKYKSRVGLPLATYFSGPKVKWILDNVEGARERAEAGNLVMGNMDTWVIWNLTGGVDGGVGGVGAVSPGDLLAADAVDVGWMQRCEAISRRR